MLELIDIDAWTSEDPARILLRQLTLRISPGDQVVIVAPSGGNAKALINTLTGRLKAQDGHRFAKSAIVSVADLARDMHPRLTVADNLRIIAGVHNIDQDQMAASVVLAMGGEVLDLPAHILSPQLKGAVALCVCQSINNSVLIFDHDNLSISPNAVTSRFATRPNGPACVHIHTETPPAIPDECRIYALVGPELITATNHAELIDILSLAAASDAACPPVLEFPHNARA